MTDAGRPEEPREESDRTDDDALADAILAIYTSSIPIVGSADGVEGESPEADRDTPDIPEGARIVEAEPLPEVAPNLEAEPTPPSEPVVASEPSAASDPATPSEPSASFDPAALSEPAAAPEPAHPFPPTPPVPPLTPTDSRVWDLDDDEPVSASRVWDLGDLPESVPFDAPSVAVPEPTEPPPGESWTRLVEPEEAPEPDAPTAATPWAPPVWEPERVATPAPPEPPSVEESFSVFSDAGVDPAVLERMQEELRGPVDEPADDAPPVDASVIEPVDPAPVESEPDAVDAELPPESDPARVQPTPWFDLASAPPPDPSTSARPAPRDPAPSYPAPIPPPLVEPPATEPVSAVMAESEDTERADEPDVVEPDVDEADVDEAGVDEPDVDQHDEEGPDDPEPPVAPPPAPILDDPSPSAEPHPEPPAEHESAPPRLPDARHVERVGIEPTPREQRAGRAGRLFWLWFASNASLLSVAAGAVLFTTGMSLRQVIISALLGVAVSFLPLGISALVARGSGMPTLVTSRATFGIVGNVLPVLLAIVTRAVVGGVLLWLVGEAARTVLARYGLPALAGTGVLVVVAVLAAVLAAVGYGLLSRTLFVLAAASGVLLVGLVVLTGSRIDLTRALSVPDGPWVLLLTGAVLVVSLVGLAWTQSGDLARYQSRAGSGSGSVVSAAAGAGLPALILVAWGALLSASSPALARELAASPASALVDAVPAWAPLPLLAVVLVSSLAGAAIAMYSGGFAIRATGIRMPRSAAVVVAGVLALAAGLGLDATGIGMRAVLADVLTTIAVPVAAWAGIVGGETLLRRRRLHAPSLLRRGGAYPAVRTVNLAALVVVTAIGWGLLSSTLAGLRWEGWFFPLVGIPRIDPIAQSDVGVIVALALGVLVPLVSAVRPVRRQEAVTA